MARIRIFGQEMVATPIEQLDKDTWLMRAEQHTARTTVGTVIKVKRAEVIEMAAAEFPASNEGEKTDRAMAEERKTLPSPEQVIETARTAGTLPNPKQDA